MPRAFQRFRQGHHHLSGLLALINTQISLQYFCNSKVSCIFFREQSRNRPYLRPQSKQQRPNGSSIYESCTSLFHFPNYTKIDENPSHMQSNTNHVSFTSTATATCAATARPVANLHTGKKSKPLKNIQEYVQPCGRCISPISPFTYKV